MKNKLVSLSKEIDVLNNINEKLISLNNDLENENAMLISSNVQLKKENELLKKEVVTSHVISTKSQMVKKI